MNNSIKRAQSQARLSFAERENFRPKVRQYKKLMMTLALLLTAVGGAYATEFTSLKQGDVLHVGDVINTSTDYTICGLSLDANSQPATLVRADIIAPITITESETGAYYLLKNKDDGYYGIIITHDGYDGGYWPVTDTSDGISVTAINPGSPTELTFAVHEGPASSNAVAITWDEATKTATIASMPGSNVVLTPIYARTAAFATTGTEPEVTTLLPAAAEGVIAGTDAPLIVEGTVAFAGQNTEVKQGTVMYAVTAATATEAPALTSSDWKTTVPTAKDIADDGAEVKVWYYILGADAPDGEAATLDNTFNNSDICATPLTVTVLSNLFDLTLKAANVNTIDATDASKGTVTVKEGTGATVDKTKDITNGKLEGIKMGSEVKLITKAGYKFRKVEVKKASTPTLKDALADGAVTRIKFNSSYYADFTYSNGSFTRTGGSNGYTFSGSWTMKEENGVLTMTANYNEMNTQFIDFVCTFYVDDNEYTVSSTGSWTYSFSGIEVNGTDITSQLTKVK